METPGLVGDDLVEEALGLPVVRPEGDGDGLAKVVELEAARAHRVHDRGVVHGLRGDVEVAGAEQEVKVRRGAEGIANLVKISNLERITFW